jgi:hypothetical protein
VVVALMMVALLLVVAFAWRPVAGRRGSRGRRGARGTDGATGVDGPSGGGAGATGATGASAGAIGVTGPTGVSPPFQVTVVMFSDNGGGVSINDSPNGAAIVLYNSQQGQDLNNLDPELMTTYSRLCTREGIIRNLHVTAQAEFSSSQTGGTGIARIYMAEACATEFFPTTLVVEWGIPAMSGGDLDFTVNCLVNSADLVFVPVDSRLALVVSTLGTSGIGDLTWDGALSASLDYLQV